MVDWSKYDDEAQKAVQAERVAAQQWADQLAQLLAVTRSHVERLTEAGVPYNNPGWRLWSVGRGRAEFQQRDFFINADGQWISWAQFVEPVYPNDQSPFAATHEVTKPVEVHPPILDVDELALELSKHFFRATGK